MRSLRFHFKFCTQTTVTRLARVKNTIRDGGSTALYAVVTVDTVDTVYTV